MVQGAATAAGKGFQRHHLPDRVLVGRGLQFHLQDGGEAALADFGELNGAGPAGAEFLEGDDGVGNEGEGGEGGDFGGELVMRLEF